MSYAWHSRKRSIMASRCVPCRHVHAHAHAHAHAHSTCTCACCMHAHMQMDAMGSRSRGRKQDARNVLKTGALWRKCGVRIEKLVAWVPRPQRASPWSLHRFAGRERGETVGAGLARLARGDEA